MKKIFVFVCAGVLLAATGCSTLADNRSAIRDAIVEYLAREGQARAEAYVDKLVEQGKLSPDDAAAVKAAIPQGIKEVKGVLK